MSRGKIACVLLSLAVPSLAGAAGERPAKPNVVFILTDDLGWQDVGCYDIDEPCPFETPNIDRLASEGIQFWQGYSPAPTCAPTRVAILSGKHPARSQKTHVVGGSPPTPYSERSPMISPWYSGRMGAEEITIAEVLKADGYATGCVGKWHCAIHHHASPQAKDQGFDYARMNLGTTRKMKNRLRDFATDAEDDPHRLDENGFPRHENSEDAIEFVRTHSDKPFFLYYSTWLVHTPIHTRSEILLRKYCDKMGLPFPSDPNSWKVEGQKNPYYGAMVESLDYYVGRLLAHLAETEDPRWPGHKLSENTYVIFTSDNGGMESTPTEQITDNYPLDRGKINAKEGGVRVPLIIKGPGIPAGRQSHTMLNGLDFYPTILSWAGAAKPASQHLDGLDLSKWLVSVKPGELPRDTMVWHFPHSGMQSTIRQGSYKLIRNWRGHLGDGRGALELYQLYDDETGALRVDIEESKNLATKFPEKAKAMNAELEKRLSEMKASPPFLNPHFRPAQAGSEKIPEVVDSGQSGEKVWLSYREAGAKVVRAQLIYTDNGGARYEEWYRLPVSLSGEGRIEIKLPADTTHYVWNLIDENHYLVSHPRMRTEKESKEPFSKRAIAVAPQ